MTRVRPPSSRSPRPLGADPAEGGCIRTSIRATPAPRWRIRVHVRRVARRCPRRESWRSVKTRCSCPADTATSQRDLAPSALLPGGREEVVIESNFVERVPLQEILVGRAELGSVASQAFKNSESDDSSDRLAPASQLDLNSGFGLVDDAGEATSSLCDGVPVGHTLECTSKCTWMQCVFGRPTRRCTRRPPSYRCAAADEPQRWAARSEPAHSHVRSTRPRSVTATG
jgi:hypothetical protein